jgi:hypothetical protein
MIRSSKAALVCTVIMTAGTAALAFPGEFQLRRSTLYCGGGTSAGGVFRVTGTLGQTAVGTAAGGDFTLSGGYWAAGGGGIPCPADCGDDNGQVATADLLALLSQWGGPGSCDLNGDLIVSTGDLLDLLGEWGPCP